MTNDIKKILSTLFISVIICLVAESCRNKDNKECETPTNDISTTPGAPTFFGDSTLTIISSNKPNEYSVKFFQTKDLTLINLSRGDSINQYVALHEIPLSVYFDCFPDLTYGDKPAAIGTYVREVNIPIENDLGIGLFFMDVNFDGEHELVIEHPGYNRTYYACFDIVKGSANITPGVLQPMNDAPFNNIVSGGVDIYTEFDYDKKTIHIFEQMGCCSHVEIWCEMVSDYDFDVPKIQVVRREDVDYTANGYVVTTNYKRVDGELKNVSSTRKKCNPR